MFQYPTLSMTFLLFPSTYTPHAVASVSNFRRLKTMYKQFAILQIYTTIVPSSWLIFHLLIVAILPRVPTFSESIPLEYLLLNLFQTLINISGAPVVLRFSLSYMQLFSMTLSYEVQTAHPCVMCSSRGYVTSLCFSLDLSQQGIIYFTTLPKYHYYHYPYPSYYGWTRAQQWLWYKFSKYMKP